MLKKNILLLIFSFGAIILFRSQIVSGGASNFGKTIDEIVAQVGDIPVLLSDIEAQRIQLQSEGREVDEMTNCNILEELLYQNLLLNQAKLDSIDITDGQVRSEE